MGMVKKSITVTDQQDQWIKSRIESGDYGNESEVLRDLIRKEQQRDTEIDLIRSELIKAEHSGFSERTPEEIRDAVIRRKRKNGQL